MTDRDRFSAARLRVLARVASATRHRLRAVAGTLSVHAALVERLTADLDDDGANGDLHAKLRRSLDAMTSARTRLLATAEAFVALAGELDAPRGFDAAALLRDVAAGLEPFAETSRGRITVRDVGVPVTAHGVREGVAQALLDAASSGLALGGTVTLGLEPSAAGVGVVVETSTDDGSLRDAWADALDSSGATLEVAPDGRRARLRLDLPRVPEDADEGDLR